MSKELLIILMLYVQLFTIVNIIIIIIIMSL